jgi:hypothetical protein
LDFLDSNGGTIGQWRIYNNKIEVVLNANVAGKQSISAEFISGASALTSISLRLKVEFIMYFFWWGKSNQ